MEHDILNGVLRAHEVTIEASKIIFSFPSLETWCKSIQISQQMNPLTQSILFGKSAYIYINQ